MNKPDFFIIGAMKCGTTTLHRQLAAQQGFFMTEPKEPNFFSDNDVFARGTEWYASLFSDAPTGSIKGESSTHYTKLPTHSRTIPRLLEYAPNARFIYVMRHPIDRLISHYIHEWTMGIYVEPIDEAIERHAEMIDYSCYNFQLTPWIEQFGRSRILPIFFERMTACPQETLEEVAAFLGHKETVSWRDEEARANASSERLKRLPMQEIIIENPVATFVRRNFVPQSLRDNVKKRLRMEERPTPSPQTIASLTKEFDRDLGKLGDLLGAQINCETFKKVALGGPARWAPH